MGRMAAIHEEGGHADKGALGARFQTSVERCFQWVDGSVYNDQKKRDNNVSVCTSAAAFYDFASVSEMEHLCEGAATGTTYTYARAVPASVSKLC